MSRGQGLGARGQENLELEVERYEYGEGLPYSFEPDRREFFMLAGAGLAVFLVAADALAQQPPNRRPAGMGGAGRPQEVGAYLHVGADGKVTVFSGKVELGQNIRTSLSQVVAEELRVPVGAVVMVLADTDRTPFDMGTFGSRTTPDMAVLLRRVAATAREWLIDLAAEQGGAKREALTAADGKVSDKSASRTWTYAELAKDKKLTKTIAADAKLTPAGEWKVEGKSVPKVDGREIVTGKLAYSADIKRSGMLFGKVLRPETLGATLSSVDLKAAEALPGVVAVQDNDFVGVAAPSVFAAEQALAAIKAEWKKPAEPATETTLWEQLKKPAQGGGRGGGGFGGRGGGPRGSIEDGLAAAEHKLAATYHIAYIAHCPLEPRAAVAEWNDGKLTVWAGIQTPFRMKNDLAQTFRLSADKVRVIAPATGSGYGGKQSSEAAIEAARLAKAAGKPVKLVWTREEEFTWAYFRPAGVIEINAGVSKDGKITAWEFHNYNSGGSGIDSKYDIPNLKTQSHGGSSPLRQGSYRALASTANHFARESHIDDLARAVGLDPLEFRLKNTTDGRFRGVLEAAAKQFGWGQSKSTEKRAFGLAAGFEKGSYVATCAEIEVDDGQVRVVRAISAFDCGAVLNPEHLKNQIEGAVVMGLGGALFEAVHFDSGKIKNAALSKYRVPRFSDTPLLETVLIDRKDVPSAGAGETPIVCIAPAVGNAICAATGERLRSMPMVPQGLKGS
jgi:isoquinoline 1-oxidoreductase